MAHMGRSEPFVFPPRRPFHKQKPPRNRCALRRRGGEIPQRSNRTIRHKATARAERARSVYTLEIDSNLVVQCSKIACVQFCWGSWTRLRSRRSVELLGYGPVTHNFLMKICATPPRPSSRPPAVQSSTYSLCTPRGTMKHSATLRASSPIAGKADCPLSRSKICYSNFAAGLGLEPRYADPESAVLPLDDPAIR